VVDRATANLRRRVEAPVWPGSKTNGGQPVKPPRPDRRPSAAAACSVVATQRESAAGLRALRDRRLRGTECPVVPEAAVSGLANDIEARGLQEGSGRRPRGVTVVAISTVGRMASIVSYATRGTHCGQHRSVGADPHGESWAASLKTTRSELTTPDRGTAATKTAARATRPVAGQPPGHGRPLPVGGPLRAPAEPAQQAPHVAGMEADPGEAAQVNGATANWRWAVAVDRRISRRCRASRSRPARPAGRAQLGVAVATSPARSRPGPRGDRRCWRRGVAGPTRKSCPAPEQAGGELAVGRQTSPGAVAATRPRHRRDHADLLWGMEIRILRRRRRDEHADRRPHDHRHRHLRVRRGKPGGAAAGVCKAVGWPGPGNEPAGRRI
jgi:hypothetical protein